MDEHDEEYQLIKEEVRNEIDENGNTKIIIMKYFEKKNKYAENIKKAVSNYHKRNKEVVNKKIMARQKERYHTDPEYREKIREQQKISYQKRKQMKEL